MKDNNNLHLLISSGGSRAILAGAGAILACAHAGISNWKSIGGISGGSLPAIMLASGMDAKTTVSTALDVDFASLLTKRGSMAKIMLAYMLQSHYEKTLPRYGVLSSEKVGTFVESIVSHWPVRYWTMANNPESQFVFTASGVHHLKPGLYRLLNTEPGPLGVVVRGTCAVPGIIDAVPIEISEEVYWLHDGAISPEGRTPVSVPEKFFGALAHELIVVDVGDSKQKGSQSRKAKTSRFFRRLCGRLCLPTPSAQPLDTDKGYILIEPEAMKFGSLKFTLTRDEKWMAVMSGFNSAVKVLAEKGFLCGEALAVAEQVVADYRKVEALTWGSKSHPEGSLTSMTEEILSKAGIW